jgi:hypothetical protein
MSRIFLPNGGQIEIQNNWTSTINPDGSISYHTTDEKKSYLGIITSQGVVHLSSICRYTYYPPPIHSVDSAYNILRDNVKNLKPWQLKELKQQLQEFNAKSYSWK